MGSSEGLLSESWAGTHCGDPGPQGASPHTSHAHQVQRARGPCQGSRGRPGSLNPPRAAPRLRSRGPIMLASPLHLRREASAGNLGDTSEPSEGRRCRVQPRVGLNVHTAGPRADPVKGARIGWPPSPERAGWGWTLFWGKTGCRPWAQGTGGFCRRVTGGGPAQLPGETPPSSLLRRP